METQNFGFWRLDELTLREGFFALPELSVIEVSGEDAVDFVHGQLTNRIKDIDNEFRLAAYCQPRGRVLSLMRVYKNLDRLYLIMPTELITGFVKRFSMFILRSKVSLRVANELCVVGAINPKLDLPEIDKVRFLRNTVIARVGDVENLPRCLLIAERKELESYAEISDESAFWFVSEMLAGIPWIGEKTKEAFVPQWINLDLIGGVVFNKGCYPGQEVIARVQHIGETPRRMCLAKAQKSVAISANEDIFQNDQPVGSVVMAAVSAKETIVLCQLSKEAIENQTVQIQATTFSIS